MIRLFALLLGLCAPLFLPAESAQDNAFKWHCQLEEKSSGEYLVSVTCQIAEKAYLYSSQTAVQAVFADNSTLLIPAVTPTSEHDNEAVYPGGNAMWQVVASQKPLHIQIEYQGCIGAMCLMPETLQLALDPAESVSASAVNSNAENSLPDTLDTYTLLGKTSGLLGESELVSFIETANHHSKPTADTGSTDGFWAVFLLVILGGLGLNFTPCVLPMIPINLAIIGASGSSNSRFQGFRRGLAYALGITLTYGILGLLASFTGNSFGELNSSSLFNLAIAIIFVILSLGMLGVYELDLTRLGNLFRRKSSSRKSRKLPPEVSALVMGITAALLAGACVAPVVITVLVLTAQLWSEGNFWALILPFALGLAMALPWPLLGAGLSFLPKPGAWMVKVKLIFGMIILLMALYYAYLAWSLRPDGFSQTHAVKEFVQKLDEAAPGEVILVDCWATWCKNCAALETTLNGEKITSLLENSHIKLIRFQTQDLNDPAIKAFMQKYDLPGLPSLLLLKKDGGL